MKIKIFSKNERDLLEADVNAFIADKEVVDIKQSMTSFTVGYKYAVCASNIAAR